MLQPGQPVPDDVKPLLGKPAVRADFEVEISGYGKGGLSLLAS